MRCFRCPFVCVESRDIGLVGTRGPCESGRYSKTPMVNVISVEDLHIISFHMMFNLTAGLFYELSLSRLSREGGEEEEDDDVSGEVRNQKGGGVLMIHDGSIARFFLT